VIEWKYNVVKWKRRPQRVLARHGGRVAEETLTDLADGDRGAIVKTASVAVEEGGGGAVYA
jgi:hypothetical protein